MGTARIPTSLEADEIRQNTPIAAIGDHLSPPLGSHPAREEHRFAPWRAGLPYRLALRSSAARYGLAVIFAAAAYVAAILLETGTGKFTSFPFYAAVVAGAWLGVGPGLLSVVLSSVAAADFWTPARYSIYLEPVDLPSFAAFVVFALMTLAWSMQRRHAQQALEATVQQRTTELAHMAQHDQGQLVAMQVQSVVQFLDRIRRVGVKLLIALPDRGLSRAHQRRRCVELGHHSVNRGLHPRTSSLAPTLD